MAWIIENDNNKRSSHKLRSQSFQSSYFSLPLTREDSNIRRVSTRKLESRFEMNGDVISLRLISIFRDEVTHIRCHVTRLKVNERDAAPASLNLASRNTVLWRYFQKSFSIIHSYLRLRIKLHQCLPKTGLRTIYVPLKS